MDGIFQTSFSNKYFSEPTFFKVSWKMVDMRIQYCSQDNVTHFFISNTFISNAWLKLAKKQAKAKHHPDAELLLFEKYSLFSSTFLSKNNTRYAKNVQKASESVLIKLYD